MVVEEHTLEILEFAKVREMLAGFAACSLGKELARLVEPTANAEQLRHDLGLVTEMARALDLGQAPPFGGVHDVRMLVRRASIGSMLTPDQLLEVADTLAATGHLYRYRMRLDERLQGIIALITPIEDLGMVAKSIHASIDARGHVLDLASRELALVRQKLAEVDEKVQNQIKRLLRDPELRKVLRYPNATVSGDHYVLPVAVNYRHKLPGVVHRTSSTGETIFIEPAGVASLSAERTVLKGEEEREIRRILRRLTEEVAKVATKLQYALGVIAQLDLITAKARFSRDYRMSQPDITTDRLWLRVARHPLLEQLFRHDPPESRRDVVPIDVRLGGEFHMLVITGPNTGGKTVSLKTTGLLCLMALSGMHIPAGDGSQVPHLAHILADIGDEQSLEQSLSTFSSHMSRIATILRIAGDRSLVLLDELGAGTDPTEGAALGRAILDQLDHQGCMAMVTTHLGDLKTYAFGNKRAENAAVEFDIETLRPTYRLLIGQYGMSNALKIGRRLKLPRELLRRAHRYLKRRQKRNPELAQLQQVKADAERAREEAMLAQKEAEQKRREYVEQVEAVQREKAKQEALRDARSKLKPNDPVRVERFDKPGKVVRIDFKKNTALVATGLGQWEVPLDELYPVE